LFVVIKRLKAQGKSIIFISHKLREVLALADRISVLRRGKLVGDTTPAQADEAKLASMMVGRDVVLHIEKSPATPGEVVLDITHLQVADERGNIAVSDVSLQIRRGEIVGIAGVQGNGQTELVAAVTAGYCVPICSDVGFAATRTRDSDGFLPRGGTWNHCMVVIGVRFADGPGKKDGCLVLNSWGPNWVAGPKWPADQPDGSFWCTRANIEAILRQGDSFAIGGVTGFPWRKLEHKEWLSPPPQASRRESRIDHSLAL
jgi:hypothetical protein